MRTANICPDCAFYTSSKCIIYNGEYIPCFDISPGDSIELALQKIANVICTTTTTTATPDCDLDGQAYIDISATTTTTTIVITPL